VLAPRNEQVLSRRFHHTYALRLDSTFNKIFHSLTASIRNQIARSRPIFLKTYIFSPTMALPIRKQLTPNILIPHTPRKTLDAAFVDLHPDYPSYAKAATSTHWSRDAINHSASSHGGASGGGLYNDDGKRIGILLLHHFPR